MSCSGAVSPRFTHGHSAVLRALGTTHAKFQEKRAIRSTPTGVAAIAIVALPTAKITPACNMSLHFVELDGLFLVLLNAKPTRNSIVVWSYGKTVSNMPVFLGGKITAITAITTLFHSTVKQSLKALQADHVLVTESAERRSDTGISCPRLYSSRPRALLHAACMPSCAACGVGPSDSPRCIVDDEAAAVLYHGQNCTVLGQLDASLETKPHSPARSSCDAEAVSAQLCPHPLTPLRPTMDEV
ncbi:hypothetical protein THAOC_25595 [Thalassiosira oceanica]|uniref:Uncharacterized protein n=1 Tax=Thalassiosira oceanica TaxID=159749 RepID=K0RNY4_THAOC|nr:hypothetical protein THAOC_25595 [Thalassiosira oceanica]|eukprot:EJK54750.1 hypothetical protein THAOC_25595 [Thalassiosira oceanica]